MHYGGCMEVFLKIIDELLKERGEKRPWLSKQTGISLSTINTWYNEKGTPNLPKVLKVARALEVPLDQLATGKEPENKYSSPVIKEIVDFLESKNEEDLRSTFATLKMIEHLRSVHKKLMDGFDVKAAFYQGFQL